MSDALIDDLHAPGSSGPKTGSRTAIARSGRDGRLLWKSVLDPPRVWFERDRGESFGLAASPLPDGDLDGDGMPGVVVRKYPSASYVETLRRPATLPLHTLSGRTGRPLWSAGPLPLGFTADGYSRIRWVKLRARRRTRAPT